MGSFNIPCTYPCIPDTHKGPLIQILIPGTFLSTIPGDIIILLVLHKTGTIMFISSADFIQNSKISHHILGGWFVDGDLKEEEQYGKTF